MWWGGLPVCRRAAAAATGARTAAKASVPTSCRLLSTASRASSAASGNGSENGGKPRVAERASGFEDTVWVEFTPLAQKHGAVNLSQGLPSIPVEPFILSCMQSAVEPGMHHQYTRVGGHPRLVNALAQHYSPEYNRAIDPLNNICITTGATQGLLLFFQTFVDHGDEVVIVEPFYDSYIPQIEMCGGKAVAVPLKPPSTTTSTESLSAADWSLNLEQLEAAFSSRTKAILLNTPHNPSGKVFSHQELKAIGHLAQKHDVLILADEVYEKIVYDGEEHVHVASLSGLWDRTVSLGSVGKAFNTTGWKIGWAIGPDHLILPMQRTQQYTPFCVTTPLQEALAHAFEQTASNGFFQRQKEMFAKKRARLVDILRGVGLKPTIPQGSYFILADTSEVDFPVLDERAPFARDYDFCRWLTAEVGVAAIPPSCFYTAPHKHLAQDFARFCFVKTDEDIEEAGRRLTSFFS